MVLSRSVLRLQGRGSTVLRAAMLVLLTGVVTFKTSVAPVSTQGVTPHISQLSSTTFREFPFLLRNDGSMISNDGTLSAFVLKNSLLNDQLFVASADGSEVRLISGPALSIRVSQIASTFNRKIVFAACPAALTSAGGGSGCGTSNLSIPGDLYIGTTDGAAPTRLTFDNPVGGDSWYMYPILSPDDGTVAFSMRNTFGNLGNDRLFLMNADGTNRRELTIPVFFGQTVIIPLSFTRDNSQLAFYISSGSLSKIAVINTDGTGFHILVDSVQGPISGDWSTKAYIDNGSLFVANTDGSAPVFVDSMVYPGPFSLSYDGSVVAYTRYVNQQLEIAVSRRDGTNIFRVVAPQTLDPAGFSLNVFSPTVSQDGSAVAFFSNADLDPGKNPDLSDEAFVASLRPTAPPPTVTAISPIYGPTTGGTSVTITGTNFVLGASVRFGDVLVPGLSVTFVDRTTLQVITPPRVADVVDVVVDVSVVNPDAQTGVLQGGFTYVSPPVVPVISIGDVTVLEGDSGPVDAVFTVSLSAPTTREVAVDFATADRTARVADGDYVAASGTVRFAPGTRRQVVVVEVRGDTEREFNEFFELNLSGEINGTIEPSQRTGIGEITNDDPYVLLVHGWCGSPKSFERMGDFLQADLGAPSFVSFDYAHDNALDSTKDAERSNLRALADRFARFVKDQEKFFGVGRADVVAHSMGGLLVRAWMSGLTSIPYENQIRRLVTAGTPNYGVPSVYWAAALPAGFICNEKFDVQANQQLQMTAGSEFLTELNRQWKDKVTAGVIKPQDILTIAGCRPDQSKNGSCGKRGDLLGDDGLVDAASATLPVPLQGPDYTPRYVRRYHFTITDLGVHGLVGINDRTHETYQLVSHFFAQGTGGLPVFYPLKVARGLIAVPVTTETGEPFMATRNLVFGGGNGAEPFLRSCVSGTTTEFRASAPPPPPPSFTGLWTLFDVDPGCWRVKVDPRLNGGFESVEDLLVPVAAGRPTEAERNLPIKVR